MNIEKAQELVTSNELAIVIFTKGDHFSYDAIGNGETGNWVIKTQELENVDKVIIYQRDEIAQQNRIFLGNYSGCRKSPEPNRLIIRFSKLEEVGTTGSNWNKFASSGQNPVSYVGNFL